MLSRLLFVILAAAALLLPAWAGPLNPNDYAGGRSKDQRQAGARNSSAFATILGEVRTSMSDLMFIKTERYLHSGVAYQVHHDLEALASGKDNVHVTQDEPEEAVAASVDSPAHTFDFEEEFEADQEEYKAQRAGEVAEEEPHEEAVPTLVRTPLEDFRGFIGYLERQVKPWLDPTRPHQHTDGTELLPWYRLMTLSDPHHIRGYLIGAWWLRRIPDDPGATQALAYLSEGIKNNPDAFQLHLMKGYTLLRDVGDTEAARKAFRTAGDLAFEQLPADEPRGSYKDEDARAAMRMAVMTEREYGSRDEALRLAEHYLTHIADDGVLQGQYELLRNGDAEATQVRDTNPA